MEIMREPIDYRAIAEVFNDYIGYYKNFDIPFENPTDGSKDFLKIHCMSMHLINSEFIGMQVSNGIFENHSYSSNPQVMIRVYISNGKKINHYISGYLDFPTNIVLMKMFLSLRIQNVLKQAVYDFLAEKVKNNKYSYRRSQKANLYIQDFDDISIINGRILEESLKQTKAIYKIQNVISVHHVFGIHRYVNIVVDTDGRFILEKRDIIKSACTVDFVDSENINFDLNKVDHVLTEQELFDKISGYYPYFVDKIALNNKRIYIDSGIYPMVFDNYSSHTFFHEAIAGHLLSAKYIVNGISSVFKREDKNLIVDEKFEILRDLIVEDRPNEPGKLASYVYDNEGIKSKDIVLIDRGVLKECLNDLNSAERMNVDSNGHALSEAYVFTLESEGGSKRVCIPPEPRISNLFVRNYNQISDEDFYSNIKQFCEEVGFDFYLKIKSTDGEVNVENGIFNMVTSEIFKVYLDGREELVGNGVLSGSLFDFIASTVLVGSTLYEESGFCGASSGFIPTTGNTPFMFLFGINFVPDKKPDPMDEDESIDINNKYIPKDF